jgi:hypothetical protein
MSTTPAKPSQEIAVSEIEITNPDDVRSVYCNNVQLSLTPWDVRLLCMEIGVSSDGSPVQAMRANVVMSISHADALLKALQTTLDQVNKQRGKSAEPAVKK